MRKACWHSSFYTHLCFLLFLCVLWRLCGESCFLAQARLGTHVWTNRSGKRIAFAGRLPGNLARAEACFLFGTGPQTRVATATICMVLWDSGGRATLVAARGAYARHSESGFNSGRGSDCRAGLQILLLASAIHGGGNTRPNNQHGRRAKRLDCHRTGRTRLPDGTQLVWFAKRSRVQRCDDHEKSTRLNSSH